jgi:hypothetical protein
MRGTIQRVITFEHRTEPLIPKRAFIARLLRSAAAAFAILLGSLGLGVFGYHVFCELGWLDSLVNASMILSGMGPVDPITTTAGKWFESAYALFSGVAFLTSVSLFLAPAIHRLLHTLHVERGDEEG